MARKRAVLAKLTQPRLHGAHAREGLFRLLDEAVESRSGVCVIGPPGSGKTTLVASWLEHRRLAGIWYQVDPGDADLGTFFYYLGLAAQGLTRKGGRPLPAYTPEYLHDLAGFARRFFRQLFSMMPLGATLVLDNYQEVGSNEAWDLGAPGSVLQGAPAQPQRAPDRAFHDVVALAIGEVPPGAALVLVSRSEPPEAYVRLIANGDLAFLRWENLKLTLDETRAIVKARLGEYEVAHLHRISEGWVTGLTLLLEHLRQGGKLGAGEDEWALRDVFDYFAAQILDRAGAEALGVLLSAGYLPRMTASMLERLSGSADAEKLLEHLYRRRLFTDRRTIAVHDPAAGMGLTQSGVAGDYVYQLHALFRSFLIHRAQATYTTEQHIGLVQRAAQLLEAGAHPDDAVDLYRRAGDWPAVRRILLREARQLITQGRWQVVLDWIRSLPPEEVQADHRLLYWQGLAQVAPDIGGARATLERAYELAREGADTRGQLQAVAAIVESYFFDYRDLTPLDRWIPVMEQLLSREQDAADVEAELGPAKALLFALTYHEPGHRMLPALVERVMQLAARASAPDLQMQAYTQLCMYGSQLGRLDVVRRVLPEIERLTDKAEVRPLHRVLAYRAIAFACHFLPDCSRGVRATHELAKLAEANGFYYAIKQAGSLGSVLELMRGRFEAARECIAQVERWADPSHAWDRALLLGINAWYGVFAGDVPRTERYAAPGVTAVDECGVALYRALYRHYLSWVLIERNSFAEAQRWLDEARRICVEGNIRWPLSWVHTHEAEIARRQDDRAALKSGLAAMFAVARETACDSWLTFWHAWMGRLCAEALREAIEVDYVKGLIRRYRWLPPVEEPSGWPWTIKVNVLGRFSLVREDQPIAFSRKTPKKPLALLKAIICSGTDGATNEELIDRLWPDSDGDSGHQTLKATIARLRNLLGEPEAIEVVGGRVKLQASLVWVDLHAFERAANNSDAASWAAAIRLYQGPVLPEATTEPWTFAARDRARQTFTRTVSRVALLMEDEAQWKSALATYQAGIRADNLMETLWQGAMRCHLALGQPAEALSVFSDLRQTLLSQAGLEPTAESRRLAQRATLTSPVQS